MASAEGSLPIDDEIFGTWLPQLRIEEEALGAAGLAVRPGIGGEELEDRCAVEATVVRDVVVVGHRSKRVRAGEGYDEW